MAVTCVHNILSPSVDAVWDDYDPAVVQLREATCGKPVRNFRPHGFLCPVHREADLQARPPAPRKPHRHYVKNPEFLLNDDAYVQRILRIEREAITELSNGGKLEVVKRGRYEPVSITLVTK
jgi:hypothetical protein